ncbi:MAG: DUF2442 domain-containing protein [Deltaproteobacteria bacterium]|nr:DUF2442 domain-containing protein [Deltaproteobacteria bacterium]MBW2150188.1 DUF2442 domain-containing protein [Deltaproteobacteria bacterium]
MKHQIYRVVDFKNIGSFVLRIRFDDGQEREIDFRPALVGELYGPLQDEKLFNQVEIDPEIHTLVWPNGADFDPETLYNWPKYAKDIIRLAGQSEPKKSQAI